jgi:hypothetical protein
MHASDAGTADDINTPLDRYDSADGRHWPSAESIA